MAPGIVGCYGRIGKFFNDFFIVRFCLALKSPVPQCLAVQELILQIFRVNPNGFFARFYCAASKLGRVQANVETGHLCKCGGVFAIFLEYSLKFFHTFFRFNFIHARKCGVIERIYFAGPGRCCDQAAEDQKREGFHGVFLVVAAGEGLKNCKMLLHFRTEFFPAMHPASPWELRLSARRNANVDSPWKTSACHRSPDVL